jgi:hypothetical protein
MQWLSFYQKYYPKLNDSQRKQNVTCLFHQDTEPSCSLDLETGLYFCHSCQEGGDVFKFYMKYHNCSFTMAKKAITGNDKTPLLTETEVNVAHHNLLNSKTLQDMLFVKRVWTLDTIKKRKLGWYDERVYIPIYDNDDILVNIRKYDVLHKSKEKFKGVQGYNTTRLYPVDTLQHTRIIVFAGEPDTLLAEQFGFPAITFTSGEGAFRESLLTFFKDKIVYICYDVDDKGKMAARLLSEKMMNYAAETYVINLPADKLPPKGDFTDLFHYCNDNKLDFHAVWNPLVEKAILVTKIVEQDEDYEKVDFYESVKQELYNKNVTYQAIAIGKNFSPYLSPKTIRFKCNFTKGESCKNCKMFFTGGSMTVDVPDRLALDLIKCSNSEQRFKLRNAAGIVGCDQFEIDSDMQAIEEIFLSPIIDSERINRQFLIRKAYTLSHNLQLNKTYSFYGKTIADAKTQEATHFFKKQVPELTDLDRFELNEDDKKNLKIFQPETEDLRGVMVKVYEIARDLQYNLPEIIIGRDNLIIAYDLVFHSVLKFKFLDSTVEKGWTELLVLGDTRTGKTKTVVKLCKHYRVGEYITLESATLPGLVGGLAQVGRDVTFSWGILPINDGRIVVLDEVNGLETKEISNLSSIRDSGVAERTVVGSTRKTSSRVRLIWISNPRSSNVRMSYYSSGVEAIRELMGRAEDISRLDFAVIVAKEDVDVLRMNQATHTKPSHIYTSELCNKVVMWAWSRKENQVKFTKEAERSILKYAIEMSEKYSDAIPLVQGSVQRIKIAKLSTALACRLFSTEDGINVIVKEQHVEFVVQFLYEIYDSTYFGYKDYSVSRKEESQIVGIDKVRNEIEGLVDPSRFVTKMLSTNAIMFDDLGDFSGLTGDKSKQFKTLLVSNNCITRKKTFFVKSPEFIKMLKEMSKKERKK